MTPSLYGGQLFTYVACQGAGLAGGLGYSGLGSYRARDAMKLVGSPDFHRPPLAVISLLSRDQVESFQRRYNRIADAYCKSIIGTLVATP